MIPALSVVYITNRSVHPLTDTPKLSQYQLLADSLKRQIFTDWELIVVDANNDIPRPELKQFGGRVRYYRPRKTPWSSAFAPSIARNAGLSVARSPIILGLDDCISFDEHLFKLVAQYGSHGWYLVPVPLVGRSDIPPGDHIDDKVRGGGIISYPRKVALDLGGHEERFAGTSALEDFEFSERLHANGVRFGSMRDAKVRLHPHMSHRDDVCRCRHAVYGLLSGQEHANVPWTPEQLEVFSAPVCPFRRPGPTQHLCAANGMAACEKEPRPSAEALEFMRTYESRPYLALVK